MSESNDNDIAIIGMAIRVPDANGPEQFWANLKAGLESVRSYTDEELLAKGVSAATLADPHYVKSGIPLQDLDQFDPEFFGFSPKEAGILDPQHRHFYEVCWEALERAGHTPEGFDGAIGLFGGCGMGAYFTFNLLTNPELVDNVGLFLLRHTGNDKDFLVTRVSYAFNLKGPSVNVQTACSTSLVATHMAVQSLLSGECDMALAGGVTIEFPHGVGYHYKEGEVLSPDGHCRSFDHRSKGTVFGSGAGVVVMRRLADALADGDHIHAVIKGSAINNDGSRKVGYLAPSVDGQAACVAEALAVADVDADTLSYVECHGTATPVGDPIEIAALTQAFRASSERVGFCKVGSVKTNIGHLDTAAGVASLIKASLALEHKQIPPSLNFEQPNPRIGFEGSPFVVASSLADWQRGSAPRRAGVNSLGVGGTNAFVVLQEPPARPPRPADDAAPQLLLLSARNRKALDENGKRLAAWLRANPEASLADVAWTLKVGRRGFEQRRVLAAADTAEAIRLLEEGDAKRVFTHSLELERPRLAFMFPGGGAQYVQMGRGLYAREPVFRQVIDQGLAILKNRFGADLAPVLLPQGEPAPDLAEQIGRPSAQLPLTFLVEIALTRLWEHYGVKPDMVIGHSMGENAAACVAGVFSFEDGLGLLLLRGQLVEQTPPGGMVSVPMAAADLKPLLGDALDLASANSPQLSVASGPSEPLDALSERLRAQGIDTQRVRVNVAGHSRLLDGILPRFRAYLQSIRLNAPRLPIVSNHTGKLLDAAQATDPEYWVQHFRHAILFADGIDTLLANDDLVFLEVGPGNMLGSFVRQNPRAPGQRVLSSMRHPQDATPDDIYFRTVMGRLWALGIAFDTERLWGKQRQRLPLPTYAFQHARYWIDPGVGTGPAKADATRPLKLPELGDWFRKPRWVQQGIVELDEAPHTWLAFVGRDALSRALVARLREAGHRVVSVLPGDTFAQVDEHGYTLAAEAGGAGYQELVEALVARELAPDRVLHGWLVTLDRAFRPGSTFLHRNQEHGFYSLFHLVRALGKAGVADAGLHLTVLANGAQRVGDEPLPFPDKATALGPCAVIPREFPAVSCAFVDLDLGSGASNGKKPPPADAEAARVAADIGDELFAPAGSRVVAWRSGVRWQRHIGPFKAAAADAAPRLRDGGAYLITGGLGGIGGVLAEWLARAHKAKLALVGRTPLPQRGDWDDWLARHKADDSICRAIVQVRRLEALGATVLPLAADVAVADSMADAVAQARQAFGAIHGVFHAAGVIRDNLIAMKSPRDVEDVFAAKVYGTLILDELFRDAPLDFMVLFSSTSAYVAPAGQVDYVGASAFVNAFAESCRGQRRYPVTAVAWGVWKDVGLVGALGATAAAGPQGDAGIAHAEALDVESPHFQRRYVSRDGLVQQHLLTGRLSAEDHWEIDEHRLGSGEALLPGTGYLELIRAALEEVGQATPWQLAHLVFEAPLFVADGAPRDFRLKLRGDGQRWDVELLAATADGFERCASARIQPPQDEGQAHVSLAAIDARCQSNVTAAAGSSRLRTRQEAHLRFGPRWRVLQRLQFGEREALARLHLAPEFVGDLATHGLHPGLLDIATGCAMDLIPGYASQDVAQNLWAPISYRSFVFHAPLEGEIASWIRLAGEGSSVRSDFAAFDVTLTDVHGRVLAEVEQLTLRRLDGPWHAPRPAVAMSAAEDAGAGGQAAKPLSPGEQALRHNVSQGIAPAEGMQALARLLAGSLPAEAIVSSMRVDELIAQAEAITRATSSGSDAARFSRPELDSDFAPPRDAVEKTLAELWGKLLGVEGVGIRDSFFDLGGHSLIAVRLFNEINDKLKVDLPMSVLMQSPTIEGLATLVRGAPYSEEAAAASAAAGAAEPGAAQPAALRFRHVVPMHSGPVAGRTPLFVVAGMFGNVLNLSHLAHLLGEERPFYALQARGLYGDASPHESFEEAAADYIAEVKQVQPEGPYLLGGFSGGGLVAYEMARQLIEAGDAVQAVLMLDTPAREIPRFSLGDKVTMLAQSAQREGLGIVVRKIESRIRWEKEKRRRRAEANGQAINGDDNGGELNFQSRRIGDAFVRGLIRYKVPKVPVKVAVFRPKLDVRYRLSGGRLVDSARNYVREDNFWTPYTQDLQVFEVPGNHDNMVLEPNVRVLVSSLRRVIDQLGTRE